MLQKAYKRQGFTCSPVSLGILDFFCSASVDSAKYREQVEAKSNLWTESCEGGSGRFVTAPLCTKEQNSTECRSNMGHRIQSLLVMQCKQTENRMLSTSRTCRTWWFQYFRRATHAARGSIICALQLTQQTMWTWLWKCLSPLHPSRSGFLIASYLHKILPKVDVIYSD